MAFISAPKIKCGDCKNLQQTFGGTFHICPKRPGKYLKPEAPRYCVSFQEKMTEEMESSKNVEATNQGLQAVVP
jgi:hypothetical protein